MSRKRKYVFATSWNCSNKLTGRKVMMLYLEVMMQLFWREMRGFIITLLDYPTQISSLMIDSGAGEKPYRIVKLLIVLPVVGSDPSLLLCRNINTVLAKRIEHSTLNLHLFLQQRPSIRP